MLRRMSDIEGALVTVLRKLDAQAVEFERLSSSLRVQGEAIHGGISQVRMLSEELERKQETLQEEFVQRHVTDPLMQELANLHSLVLTLHLRAFEQWPDELAAIAARIKQFLEDSGLTVVAPVPGERLDPNFHQPIHREMCTDPSLHGCISALYRIGLHRGGRKVQAARVAIHFHAPQLKTDPS
jgi:molecular chaperone GrpE (heat shock protein)